MSIRSICKEDNTQLTIRESLLKSFVPTGGYGFSMYNKATENNWMDRLKNWLNKL